MLSANSVQEAADFSLISQASTLKSRVPFLHFFDGFRTSHEVDKIELLGDDDLRALVDDDDVAAHRERGLSPDRPGPARLGAEPGRVLPGPRGQQPLLCCRTRASCRTRWTSWPPGPAAATAWSTTPAPPTPSGCWC